MIFLCLLSTWLSFFLRLEQFVEINSIVYLSIISAIIAIPLFWNFGLYRTINRYNNISIIQKILISNFIYGFIFFILVAIYRLDAVPYYIGQHVPKSIGIILNQ